MNTSKHPLVLAALLSAACSTHAFAQGTAFSYQGRLNSGGDPANGSYDLRFTIYDASGMAALLIAGPLTNSATAVSNGLFTAVLDFGDVFPGADRWLDIGVRTNGNGAFTPLTPRQKLTATPYAITAGEVTGSGGGLTNVNAVTLGGLGASQFWKLAGNAGTTPGSDFLGTTDPQALELKVNGARALRLEPNLSSPNIIGGFNGNFIAAGKAGVTIGGGGAGGAVNSATADYATLSGGLGNTASASSATISGGAQNSASQTYATVGGGYQNTNSGYAAAIGGGYRNAADSFYSTVSGGYQNLGSSDYGVIGGGNQNSTASGTLAATIGGGFQNNIQTGAQQAIIGGGHQNAILTGAQQATVGGGNLNLIQDNAVSAAIGGGILNTIQSSAVNSTIAGGERNAIGSNAYDATIGGGGGNWIQTNATGATIAGGVLNTILPGLSFSYATIAGGSGNFIDANSAGASIGGGVSNSVANGAPNATIGGGVFNTTLNPSSTISGGIGNTNKSDSATISGGEGNLIETSASRASIGGGGANQILNNNDSSTIGGGNLNTLQPGAGYSTIAGGAFNSIQTSAYGSTISGGQNLTIGTAAHYSTIGGGINNVIQANANYATIAGGSYNSNSGLFATVPGGSMNDAGGNYALAAGHRAKALNDGSFVWADSQDADFADTSPNQFLIRAGGGVGIGVANPAATLDVAGSARVSGLLRNGSEAGTSEAPSPTGLVVRRINSISSSAGQVVARTDTLTLERDGTSGGMIVRAPNNSGKVTITWMGIENNGTVRGGNFSIDTTNGGGYRADLFTDADNIVHAQISFGRTYDSGQHLTQVVVDRYDDRVTHDFYWSGTVTSTFNQ